MSAYWHRYRAVDLQQKAHSCRGPASPILRGSAGCYLCHLGWRQPSGYRFPTGSGKSLFFMLPAHCSTDSTTVVVVPLTALLHDLHQRCLQQGLSSAIWNSQTPRSLVQVVFVTPEAALGPAFGTFLNRLHGLHPLDRLAIDECHVVLNQQAEFRPTLQRLGELSRLVVQMVLLTAILPPRLEVLLWTRMFVNAKEVTMFRDRTTRVNIAYRVIFT